MEIAEYVETYLHNHGQRLNLPDEIEGSIMVAIEEMLANRESVLVAALERIATMPDYDQDNEHRLRNMAAKALKEYRGER